MKFYNYSPQEAERAPKLVFLDVDGVINLITADGHFSAEFSGAALANLKSVIDSTGAKIVLSSAWRTSSYAVGELMTVLARYGLDKDIIAATSEMGLYDRAVEIAEAVEYFKPEKYAVFDDWKELFHDADENEHYIFTVPQAGITAADAEKAIKMLSPRDKTVAEKLIDTIKQLFTSVNTPEV